MAPATNPRLVVAVMIDEPKVEKASGGRLAAPLFSKIMANSLRIMDIAPDARPQVKKRNTNKIKEAHKSPVKENKQKTWSALDKVGDNT